MEKDGRERKGKKLDERTGVRYKSQRLTELVNGIVLRPYVSHGTKRIGEGEGISRTKYFPTAECRHVPASNRPKDI